MKKTKKTQLLLFLLVIFLGISLSFSNNLLAEPTATYVGPEACKTCHSGQYNAWNASGHPSMLLTAAEAQARGFPLPQGISWDDIAYTIGGIWKIRYVNTSGYIITWHFEDDTKVPGGNQWNVETEQWVDYHAGEEKAYTCGGCHTTGYSPEGHQGDLPGIEGTWQFRGITCESCHGPGSLHVDDFLANPMIIDISGQVCGQCHVRPASGTWPEYEIGNASSFSYTHGEAPQKHHQQFYDWNMSEHSEELETFLSDTCLTCKSSDNIFNTDLIPLTLRPRTMTVENATNPVTCISCHSGHDLDLWITRPEIEGYPIAWELGSEADYNTVCMQCHTSGGTPETKVEEEWHHSQGELFTGSVHYESDATCTYCHMPLDTKSAIKWDLRNHTMIVKTQNTYDYSCGSTDNPLSCHGEQLAGNANWATEMIEEIQTTVSTILEKAEEAITQAEAAITTANQTTGVNQTAIEEAESLLSQAKSYSTFVEADGSLGFHNPTYALSALSTALDYSAKAESTALEARATVLASDVTTLGAQVSTLQNQVTSLQNLTTTLQGDIADLQAKIDDLESAAATVPYLYGGLGLAIGFIIGAAIIFLVRRGKQ